MHFKNYMGRILNFSFVVRKNGVRDPNFKLVSPLSPRVAPSGVDLVYPLTPDNFVICKTIRFETQNLIVMLTNIVICIVNIEMCIRDRYKYLLLYTIYTLPILSLSLIHI